MKKTVAMFLLVFCTCWSVEAQTNFRKLSYDKALAIAKQEHKQVFIDFYTDWCGPCKVMARKVFPQKKLGTYLNERFVSIQLNAEKDGKEAAQHFGVNAYPTLLVVSPDGKEIMKRVGMSDTNDLISEIEWATNPDMTPQRMAQRYGAGERTPSLVEGYAAYLSDEPGVDRREARANSQKVVFDYFNGLTVDQRLLPDNLFVYTDYLSHFTDAPVQFMVSHRSEYPIEIRPTIDSLVSRIHKDEAFYYLLLMIPYDAEAYEDFKQSVETLKLNADEWYTPFFRLIETQAKGNLQAYLDICEQVYQTLDDEQRLNLIAAQAAVMRKAEKQLKQRAAMFIRKRLENMTLSQLGNVVYPLAVLEGPDE